MKIHKAKPEDAEKISELITDTINKINAKDYPKKQLDFELSCYTVQRIKECIKKDLVFISKEFENIIGVVILDIKENTINSLYLRSDYIGKGIGKELMKFIEEKAKKLRIKRLKLYSTKYAKEFYLKQGYEVKGEFIGTKNGGFPVTEMEKILQ